MMNQGCLDDSHKSHLVVHIRFSIYAKDDRYAV